MELIWVSIIIPTLGDNKTIQYLPLEELESRGVEVIEVRDRWCNVSRSRNIGAAVAKGRVLCFIDDDAV